MAANAGDYDQAQSLRAQLDSLDKTIQNEYKSTIASNKAAATAYNKEIDTQVKDATSQFESDVNEVMTKFAELGPKFSEQYGGADAMGLVYSMLFRE